MALYCYHHTVSKNQRRQRYQAMSHRTEAAESMIVRDPSAHFDTDLISHETKQDDGKLETMMVVRHLPSTYTNEKRR